MVYKERRDSKRPRMSKILRPSVKEPKLGMACSVVLKANTNHNDNPNLNQDFVVFVATQSRFVAPRVRFVFVIIGITSCFLPNGHD